MATAVVAAPSQAHRTEPTFTQDGFPHVLLPHPWAPLHASTAPQPPVAFAGSNRQRTQRPGPQTKPRSSITPAGHVRTHTPAPRSLLPLAHTTQRGRQRTPDSVAAGEVGRGTSLRKVGRSFSPADPPQLAPRKQRRSAKRLASRLVPGFWSDPRRLGGRSAVVGGGALLVSCRQRLDRPRPRPRPRSHEQSTTRLNKAAAFRWPDRHEEIAAAPRCPGGQVSYRWRLREPRGEKGEKK